MKDLRARLLEKLEWDTSAIKAEINRVWPDGDDVEITNEAALKLFAYLMKWQHARTKALILALVELTTAIESSNKTLMYVQEEYANGHGA